MELTVSLKSTDALAGVTDFKVTTFDDQDKIAHAVAAAVKRWLRQVPLRKDGSRIRFDVYASWSERTPDKEGSDTRERTQRDTRRKTARRRAARR